MYMMDYDKEFQRIKDALLVDIREFFISNPDVVLEVVDTNDSEALDYEVSSKGVKGYSEILRDFTAFGVEFLHLILVKLTEVEAREKYVEYPLTEDSAYRNEENA